MDNNYTDEDKEEEISELQNRNYLEWIEPALKDSLAGALHWTPTNREFVKSAFWNFLPKDETACQFEKSHWKLPSALNPKSQATAQAILKLIKKHHQSAQ